MRRTCLFFVLLGITAYGQTRSRLADYAVILDDPPVAQKSQSRAELFSARMQPHLQKIQDAQRGVLNELARRKVPVSGTSQILLNAIFVTADYETAAQLRSIPGVAHVVYAPRLKPDLNTAAGLINTSAAWSAVGGAGSAGAGIKIGVIDSGIDNTHPAFQDSTLTPPSGYPMYDAGYQAYTNSKIIVARSFVNLAPYPDPDSRNYVPDDLTPRDRLGHGTAIAMIAAGAAVQAPLGGANVTLQGIAPKAFLGNYKVQGSPGVNTYARTAGVVAALTAALNDKMDIVALAYGEGDMPLSGPLDVDAQACSGNAGGVCDLIAQAVENAVSQGMVVVTSAGNDGNLGPRLPTLNTIHTPGTAPSGITVGASTNSHVLYQAVHAVSPAPPANLQSINALFGDGPQVQAVLQAPIKDVTQLGNDGLACAALATQSPVGPLVGTIALIQRGTCDFSTKITNAQNAGAVGVVIYQSSGNETPYSSWGASDTGIPAMMVGYSDGLRLKNWVDTNPAAAVSLDPTFSAVGATSNAVADFSSRGPAIGTIGIKPEIVAPGVGIYTATQKLDSNSPMYSPSGYTGVNGTSMAVGMAAGVAAMVKQTHPSLSPAQIKSAVVNTATSLSGYRVTDQGAGLLNAQTAVGALTTFEPAALSFGSVASASLPMNLTLTLTNLTNSTENITLTPAGDADSLASLKVIPSTLTLAGGQRTSVTVTLQGSQPALGSYQGAIQAVVNGSTTYRVPYLYISTNGAFDSAILVEDGSFIGATGDTQWPIFLKALDKYGLPVVGSPVQWSVQCPNNTTQPFNVGCASSGGGSFYQSGGTWVLDANTAKHGLAGALVNLGKVVGDNIFIATIGGQTVTFDGYARGYQTVASNGIVDAAAFQPLQIPNGFAPGSYISIFGNYLAPTLQAFSTSHLPYALSDVSVGFYTPSGQRYAARVPFVSPNQINVQVPWELQGQTSAQMVIRIGDEPSDAYQVPLAQYSPGAFQYWDPSSGKPYASAIDLSAAGYYWVGPFSPAKRGDTVKIYANGLGPVNNQPATGEITGASVTTQTAPTVTIGGKTAPLVRQAGAAMTPGWIGVYEIDVQVPADAPTGTQQMTITVGGVTSQPVSFPVQ